MEYYKIKSLKSLTNEKWKPIIGYKNYFISNMGRVKKILKSESEYHIKIHAQYTDPKGYPSFLVSIDGIKKRLLTHRVVAIAFLDNPEQKPMVNHKNGIRTDARAENLEFVTCSENHLHAYKELNRKPYFTGRIGKSHPRSKAVLCTTTNKTYESINQAAIELNLKTCKIAMVCQGTRKSHGGLQFKYLEK